MSTPERDKAKRDGGAMSAVPMEANVGVKVSELSPTAQAKVDSETLNRAVDIMRSRVDQLGVSEPSIQTTGNNLITVGLPDVHDVKRAENEVGQTAQLHFYDWEANALTPNGKTVASQLVVQNPQATQISQGTASAPPGNPGAGSMNLWDAVNLAAKQKPDQQAAAVSKK